MAIGLNIFKFIEPYLTVHIGDFISTTVLFIARSHFDSNLFCNPILSKAKHLNGSGLVIDTWVNTACAGKYSFVEKFVLGKFINAKRFTMALYSLENLPIANVLYSYDATKCETTILDVKTSILLCDKMEDLLIKSIQSEEVGARVDTRPTRYYTDDS